MEELISKELFGEVVKCKEIWSMKIYETDIYTIRYAGLENNCGGSINIFQLAYKCKEWAFNKGYIIETCYSGLAKIYVHGATYPILPTPFKNNSIYEPEAVFKACQWILDNNKKDNQ